MRRLLLLPALLLPLVLLAAAWRSPTEEFARKPPLPSSWPSYPRFPDSSCWKRTAFKGLFRLAPSFRAPASGRPTPPELIVQRALRRFGDRRFIRRVELGPPPPLVLRNRGWFGDDRPPHDALWAYVAAPALGAGGLHPTPAQKRESMLARWELSLFWGGLRDDFCDAGRRPLIGMLVTGAGVQALSDSLHAFGQRFPNPSAAAFRRQVERVGRRYGFRIVSLRLLRPREAAPLLVVSTTRPRKQFVADVAAILSLLDPSSGGGIQRAATWEGFFFEARDPKGAFVRVDSAGRGTRVGGQWSWHPCVYPYAHSGPAGRRC